MRVVAVIPTYRNLQTLPAVAQGLSDLRFPVLIVDDGSPDGTGEWAEDWCCSARDRWVIRLPKNMGKGGALCEGLSLARELGFDAAVTVDSDGQHLVTDAARMRAEASSHELVIGARGEQVKGYPARSMFGRRLWALGVRALTGLGVSDPICGLRSYPLKRLHEVRCRGGRYAWEEEFLVRAAWRGWRITEIPITTVYLPKEERVTHFRLGDWGDSVGMFVRLAVRRMLFFEQCASPSGPLCRRDASWRRICGAAWLVGAELGVFAPLLAAIAAVTWIAWRLHAPIPLAVIAACMGWLAVESSPVPGVGATLAIAAGLGLLLTPIVARVARSLGSS
jgi:hypothetical protein